MRDTYRDALESAVCDYSGAITSLHAGHSAQMPSVPSSFSYSTRTHGLVMRSSQSGHRPRLCVSSDMERGWKERVTVFLPRKNCLSLDIRVYPLSRAHSQNRSLCCHGHTSTTVTPVSAPTKRPVLIDRNCRRKPLAAQVECECSTNRQQLADDAESRLVAADNDSVATTKPDVLGQCLSSEPVVWRLVRRNLTSH